MANNTLIQIKRSGSSAAPGTLANGELAYSSLSNLLFIGAPDGSNTVTAIGGSLHFGTLTANAILVANSTSGIDRIITSNVQVQRVIANGSAGSAGDVLLSGGSSDNVYWVSQGSLGVNTAAQYTWTNTHLFQANVTVNAEFTVGNSTVNVAANSTLITIGNTSVNATINSSAFSGTANNADYLGGVAAASYVQNTDSRTLSGNLTLTGANLVISGTNTAISSNVTFSGANITATSSFLSVRDVLVSGNLTVNGTLTSINTTSLIVKDNFIGMADTNDQAPTDAIDFGWYGRANTAGVTTYYGIGRVAANDTFTVFKTTTEPGGTTLSGVTIEMLEAYLTSGALVSNSSAVTITANSSINVNITANSLSLSTPLSVSSGGTGIAGANVGALLYGNNTNSLVELPIGANGQVLQVIGNLPAYSGLDGGTF